MQDVRWAIDVPHILTVSFKDGTIREIKVTKRSSEAPQPGQLQTSEYARIATVTGGDLASSVPQVTISIAANVTRLSL
jgi:hypothetical protein